MLPYITGMLPYITGMLPYTACYFIRENKIPFLLPARQNSYSGIFYKASNFHYDVITYNIAITDKKRYKAIHMFVIN